MMRRVTNRQWARGSLVFVLVCLSLVVTGAFIPVEAVATAFPVGSPVQVNTATGSQLYPGTSCTYQGFVYDYWTDGTNLYYVSSPDGLIFSAPVNAFALTGIGTSSTTVNSNTQSLQVACGGSVVVVLWTTVNAGGSATGKTGFVKYEVGSMGGAGTVVFTGTIVTGPVSTNGNLIHGGAAAALAVGCVGYQNGFVFYCDANQASNNQVGIVENNVAIQNITSTGFDGGVNTGWHILFNGNGGYILYVSSPCDFVVSTDPSAFPTTATTISSSYCSTGQNYDFFGTAYGGSYYLATEKTGTGGFIVTITGAAVVGTPFKWTTSTTGAGGITGLTADTTGNFVAIQCTSAFSCQYAYTLNTWTTSSVSSTITMPGAAFSSSAPFWGMATEPLFSTQFQAFGIETATTAATFFVYNTLFGSAAAGSSTQTQVIGQCPVKNTATVTLTNNTEYFYTGSAIQGSAINQVNTFVAQVTSATAPQTLSLGIYATLNPGGVNAGNTLYLIAAYSKSLTAGTTNNQISWSPGIGLTSTIVGTIPTGATIAVAILGTNKIKINQSALAGMTTGSTAGGTLAPTFTSLSSTGTQLYLCMTLSYQSVIVSTTTTTTTISTTTTSTTTVNGVGPVPGAAVNVNLYMALAIIATLFLVPLKFAGFAGAILGAIVGFGISIAAGLLPTVYIIVLVVGLVAAFFFLRTMNAPGGGGV